MVPHLKGRALTLRRFPEGVDDTDAAFFEKRCPKHRPEWVKTATGRCRPERRRASTSASATDLPTLVWMAQLAAIELHPSLSLARKPDQPTVLAFDLDPGPPADIVDCCRVGAAAARAVRPLRPRVLPEDLGLEGPAGLRPAQHEDDYDETKPFARAMAQLLEKQTPDEVVSKMGKAERKGKVFVDWSQNHRTQDDDRRLLAAGPRAAHRLDPDHLGGGRARGRGRRRRLARLRGRRRAQAVREARRPVRAGARAEAAAARSQPSSPCRFASERLMPSRRPPGCQTARRKPLDPDPLATLACRRPRRMPETAAAGGSVALHRRRRRRGDLASDAE